MSIRIFILILFPCFGMAQSGYQQWLSAQNPEVHLLADYQEKRVYGSATGRVQDLGLKQFQVYQKGRLVRDVMYQIYPQLMYHLTINYQEDKTAKGINLVDSSEVTYAFTEENKIRYYVVDQQSAMHMIYTYNDDGLLIHCKDCLAPFGGHEWCAYYEYLYNEEQQLTKVLAYNVKKGKGVASKILFAQDSLLYENGLLQTRWTLNPAGHITQKASYFYNKKKLLEQEYSKQMLAGASNKHYVKTYLYHCNQKIKEKVEAYYTNNQLDGKQIARYNAKGRKIRQESYRGDGVRTKLYKMHYKG